MHLRLLPDFVNVIAGGKAQVNLPVGETYSRIHLTLGGAFAVSQIDRVLLRANGKALVDITGTHLHSLNMYKKITTNGVLATAATKLTIQFSELSSKAIDEMFIGALGTVGIPQGSLTLEISINAGAVNPTLSGHAEVLPPSKLGRVYALVPNTVSLAAAGQFTIPVPYGAGSNHLLTREILFHTGNVTSLEVKKNGLPIFENITQSLNDYVATSYTYQPQSNVFIYDSILSENLREVVDLSGTQQNPVRAFQNRVTVSAAETITMYQEMIANFPDL